MTYRDHFETPLGTMEVAASEHAVTTVFFVEKNGEVNANRLTELAKKQLIEYFAGDRTQFELPLQPTGTAFQKKVWDALLSVPFGTTQSYGDIAQLIDNPKGVRAVGLANGKNPLTIVVPCHRIIGANGSLTGYGGGIDRKAWLLNHERDSLF
jgi:methylated-DNA-[protein]-cysteine S-methyltransferase